MRRVGVMVKPEPARCMCMRCMCMCMCMCGQARASACSHLHGLIEVDRRPRGCEDHHSKKHPEEPVANGLLARPVDDAVDALRARTVGANLSEEGGAAMHMPMPMHVKHAHAHAHARCQPE